MSSLNRLLFPERTLIILLGWLCVFGSQLEGKKLKVPDWVRDAISRPVDYDAIGPRSAAAVLLNRRVDSFSARGVRNTKVRHVVHIRSIDGKDRAFARISKADSGTSINRFSAWMVYPSLKVESFGKSDLIRLGNHEGQFYSESSLEVLDRSRSARPGTYFAYEYEISQKTIIPESYHFFQDSVPVLDSRYELVLPDGWDSKIVPLNCQGIEGIDEEGERAWVGTDLPAIKKEFSGPPVFASVAMLGVSVYPSLEDRKRNGLVSFDSWAALAGFLEESQSDRMEANIAMKSKVASLLDGLSEDWDKIRAICEFVQSVNYIAVSMDLAKGGGLVPYPASFVFDKHYGDCKDMTVLARAMLAEAGIRSHAVIASIGKEKYVHPDWSSPIQFDHCILGVEVPEGIEAPGIVDLPEGGPILFFDPTAKYTVFGDLPISLQNSLVLVCSDQSSELIKLPISLPEDNLIKRRVSFSLGVDGSLAGRISETRFGVEADFMRGLSTQLSEEELNEYLKSWISLGTREARVSNVVVVEGSERNSIRLDLDFKAPRYARALGSKNLMVRPVFLSRWEWVPPAESDRTSAFQFHPWKLEEEIVLNLPEGSSVESIRDSYTQKTDYYSYSLSSIEEVSRVTLLRQHESQMRQVPKEGYLDVVDFFEKMTRAESAPIVVGLPGD